MIKKFLKKQGVELITSANEDIVGMCIYKDTLFVATKRCVYFLNKNKLVPVEFEENNACK